MSKTIRMTVELELDEYMQSRSSDEDDWLINHVLMDKDGLVVHSNEIGDFIGVMKVIEIDEKHEI